MADTYTSDWVEVTQDAITRFANLTDDQQYIHTDPAAAAKTPLGGTIAHGFLTLSFLTSFSVSALPPWDHPEYDVAMSMNYGFDKVRFLEPVRSGSRVRAVFATPDWRMKGEAAVVLNYAVTVEIEGAERPAIVCDWLFLLHLMKKAS